MVDHTVTFVGADDKRWRELHDRCAIDLYSSPSWCRIHEQMEGGEAAAAVVSLSEDAVLVPFVRRPIGGRHWDATSPYGFPGFLSTRRNDSGFVADAFAALRLALHQAGCVSMFLRLHPLIGDVRLDGADAVVVHGETVMVDLRADHDAWWSSIRKSHRQDIERARRLGVTSRRVEGAAALEAFASMYAETMARLGASEYHRLGQPYFEELLAGMADEVELWLAFFDGEAVAGSLFSRYVPGGIAQYLFSATSGPYRQLQPSKLILARFIEDARTAGLRMVHLGGGVGAQRDGLFSFKLGFGGTPTPFRTARFVIDPGEYLARSAGAVTQGGLIDATGFFPAYRAMPDALSGQRV